MKIAAYQSWMERSACTPDDAHLFYAPAHENGPAKASRVAAAKAICAACPVAAMCAEYALATETAATRHGIWAGLTEFERTALANGQPMPEPKPPKPAGRPRVKPVKHGTVGGYRWHVRQPETPCAECSTAYESWRQKAAENGRRGNRARNRARGQRVHGTNAGYAQHYRWREVACQECTDAHTEYARQVRAQKKESAA